MNSKNPASTAEKSDEIRKVSIRTKLIIIFGLLIAISSAIQSIIAVNKARTAIKEKIEIQLTEKAKDVAALINARIEGLLSSLQAVGNTPLMKDPNADVKEILEFLNTEKNINPRIIRIDFCDMNGIRYSGKNLLNIGDRDWYKKAISGKTVLSEPIVSRLDGSLVFVGAAPVYDDNGRLIRVLTATIKGTALSALVDDIVVGKTGNSYVIDQTGTIIAHKDIALVESQTNSIALSKTDSS
ncbi:MAG: cache domain-containing protein [Treponema sp.]